MIKLIGLNDSFLENRIFMCFFVLVGVYLEDGGVVT